MHQVFCSWSGGKDCCLACHLAARNGLKVRYLANMITDDGKRSWSHGQTPELLKVQSQALGIPLIQQRSTSTDYATNFKDMILDMKREGVNGGVFGDIDFNAHREWIEKVCQEAGITPHLPLWLRSQDKIMRDFIKLGFEAMVVSVRTDLLDETLLGQKVDLDFVKHLEELKKTRDITTCGEAGEYHTFVTDGPLFQKRIEVRESQKINEDGHAILKILKADLRAK